MFKRIYHFIASVIGWVRLKLNIIREKKPDHFDKVVKWWYTGERGDS